MIKFFRRIRFELKDKNKTGKYFKFPIGEIVLVVIGILIAFQINNWNEARKVKKQETEIVEAIDNVIEGIEGIEGIEEELKPKIK